MGFIVDWARAIVDSTKDSPLWLELVLVVVGMGAFILAVVLGLAVIGWLVSLPERIGRRWRR